jgi:hypothetical protein
LATLFVDVATSPKASLVRANSSPPAPTFLTVPSIKSAVFLAASAARMESS